MNIQERVVRRIGARLIGAMLLAAVAGCVRAPAVPVESAVLTSVASEGLTLEDPLSLPPDVVEEVRRRVASAATTEAQLRGLRDILYNPIAASLGAPFEYAPHLTLTAAEAYDQRKGDCMSFSLLFASLARSQQIPVYFVHVREVESFYERGGQFFVSSHVAVGYGRGPDAKIYDFKKEITDWKLSLYRSISDDAARALFFNNVAVDWMLSGKKEQAEKLFRALLKDNPEVAEPYNNYGVLLIRMGQPDRALAVLKQAIVKFVDYKPLYTNALLAAGAAGRGAEADALEKKAIELEKHDPIFAFGRGMRMLEGGAPAQAIEVLTGVHEEMPESPIVLAALGRAHLAVGHAKQGILLLEQARKTAPPQLEKYLSDKLARVKQITSAAQ